jgi:hypothetical protein
VPLRSSVSPHHRAAASQIDRGIATSATQIRPALLDPRCPLPPDADMICWPSFANLLRATYGSATPVEGLAMLRGGPLVRFPSRSDVYRLYFSGSPAVWRPNYRKRQPACSNYAAALCCTVAARGHCCHSMLETISAEIIYCRERARLAREKADTATTSEAKNGDPAGSAVEGIGPE